MASWPPRLRQVRHEPSFEAGIDALAVPEPLREEIYTATEFLLARNPEAFPVVPGTSLSAMTVRVWPNTPPARFLFTYDDHQVTLVAVDFDPQSSWTDDEMPR